ncbi:MAG TPA: tail fiber protein [Opitutaceae bacterium]|nr:tail fiber protein [Opitutaceae bacterium]
MSSPFVGEIRLTPYTFSMQSWASCDGQSIPIAQNEALFSLLGTTYGGDGQNYFTLPDLRGRIPVGPASGSYAVGQVGGTEQVTLQTTQLPAHTHTAMAVGAAGNVASPSGVNWAGSTLGAYADSPGTLTPMSTNALSAAGGNAAHENRMPYLALNFQIALDGVYPSQS